MYFLLILFFGSLLGITLMIGRKLLMLQNGQLARPDSPEFFLKAQSLEAFKHSAVGAIKKHGYRGLVAAIRVYFRSANLLKSKYRDVKIKIKNIRRKNIDNMLLEKREVSKFLKMVSEYKQKIRDLKHKIKEEESS